MSAYPSAQIDPRSGLKVGLGSRTDIQTEAPSTTLTPGSSIEPDVFHPVAVVDAVDHCRQPLDVRLGAGPAARVEDDRPGAFLGQPAFDLPDQLLALLDVGLGRLPVDQVVDLLVAVPGVVAYRAAHEVLIELLVGV